jgi:hypothetical protein
LDLDLSNDTYLDDFVKIEKDSNTNKIDPVIKFPLETDMSLVLSTPGLGFGVVDSSSDDEDKDNGDNNISATRRKGSFDDETGLVAFSESMPSLRDIETGKY